MQSFILWVLLMKMKSIMRAKRASWIAIGFVLLMGEPVVAQTSDADIAKLQEWVDENNGTFTVGKTSVTKRGNKLCGSVIPEGWYEEALRQEKVKKLGLRTDIDLPSSFDWRKYGGVTRIKDQGYCGSCWAFSSVAIFESAIKIATGVEEDLSEQWLVSCNTDGFGCHGGWSLAQAYHKDKRGQGGGVGAVSEVDFPYFAYDMPCEGGYTHTWLLEDWSFLAGAGNGPGYELPSIEAIKEAIYLYGPISASLYAGTAFNAYRKGIFNISEGGGEGLTNHSIALVGWNDEDSCWILRNSSGPDWGEDGYMRIRYGTSIVGYSASFVVFQDVGGPSRGFIFFDSDAYSFYPSYKRVEIRLRDRDLNIDPGHRESVKVRIVSDTEPGGEVVVLNETGPSSEFFLGSIELTRGPPLTAGLLQAKNGDTITVSYNDADDGTGSPAVASDTARVDAQGPVITDVTCAPRITMARIRWQTDELSDSTVF